MVNNSDYYCKLIFLLILEQPITITPSSTTFGPPTVIKGFGFSFSSNVKYTNVDQTPKFGVGAVSNEGENMALLIRIRPTVYINTKGSGIAPAVIDPNDKGNYTLLLTNINIYILDYNTLYNLV